MKTGHYYVQKLSKIKTECENLETELEDCKTDASLMISKMELNESLEELDAEIEKTRQCTTKTTATKAVLILSRLYSSKNKAMMVNYEG